MASIREGTGTDHVRLAYVGVSINEPRNVLGPEPLPQRRARSRGIDPLGPSTQFASPTDKCRVRLSNRPRKA